MLEHFHFLVQSALFGEIAKAILVLQRERLAKNGDLSGVRHDDADDHAQRAGLARSVGTEQAIDSAGPDAEGNVVDGDKVTVGLADVVEFNRGRSTRVPRGNRCDRDRWLDRRHHKTINYFGEFGSLSSGFFWSGGCCFWSAFGTSLPSYRIFTLVPKRL